MPNFGRSMSCWVDLSDSWWSRCDKTISHFWRMLALAYPKSAVLGLSSLRSSLFIVIAGLVPAIHVGRLPAVARNLESLSPLHRRGCPGQARA